MTDQVNLRFDQLPETTEKEFTDKTSQNEILNWWEHQFGIPPNVFDDYSFWEKGHGKIWIVHGSHHTPIRIEAFGMLALRTEQAYWKPTSNAVQRFGHHARKNTIELDRSQASLFVQGYDQPIQASGVQGYVIILSEMAQEQTPIGVGLYIDGELRSQIPKGRRIDPLIEP